MIVTGAKLGDKEGVLVGADVINTDSVLISLQSSVTADSNVFTAPSTSSVFVVSTVNMTSA